MADSIDELRLKVAIACRILGMEGLVRGTTGHVSARIPGTNEMWIRCRGGDEYGLLFTGIHNIRRVNFDGEGPGLDDKHASPNETAIHGEIYRAHPEVQAVVHAHPHYALRCGITDLQYRPYFGAYDPSGLAIILKGVPVLNRAVTITNKQLAAEMLQAMGQRDVLLMRGHGITVTGNTVESATALALRFDEVSKIMWDIATSGLKGLEISDQDREQYARSRENRGERGAGEEGGRRGWASLEGVETWGWKQYIRMLAQQNNIQDLYDQARREGIALSPATAPLGHG